MRHTIKILIDNRMPDYPSPLVREHGLSIYFKSEGSRCLFDTGASGKFAKNAPLLGVDISDIDHLFLSHGHNDHTGGLRRFMEVNKKAAVHIAKEVPKSRCYTCRKVDKRSIGVDVRLFPAYDGRFQYLTESVFLTENMAVVFNSCHDFATPRSNRTLTIETDGKEVPDLFSHEFSLALNTPAGLVVLSACSHNGVLNILQSCCEFMHADTVHRFIGGTHLVEGEFETEAEIREIAREIKCRYPAMILSVGHCTSDNAVSVLKEELGDRLELFYTGYTLEF